MPLRKRKSDLLRKPDDEPVYLTQEGFERLHERLIRLKKSMPDLSLEAQRTAAFGDRSENAEYKEAKSALRRAQRQILSIEDQIKRVAIINTGPNAANTVHLGSRVTLEIGGERKTFEILGSHETNPAHGRISHISPLGAALLNHAKKDIVTVQTPNGPRSYRIIKIT